MFISVSGMVGAGKTTVANAIADSLRASGLEATTWRFQSLPCFTLLRRSLHPSAHQPRTSAEDGKAGPATVRGAGYRRNRLTLSRTLVYLVRILAFRAYMLLWRRGEWRVFNRYFYDLFAHLDLTRRAERRYFALLQALVPIPDLAIVTVAELETVARRRPNYSSEYLREVAAAYRRLQRDVPGLVEIRTDPGDPGVEQVDALLAERLASHRQPTDVGR